MAKFVLVSDPTLLYDYHNFPLLDYLPSAPRGILPGYVYGLLRGAMVPSIGGRATLAPYSLRKIEAALLKTHTPEDVAVASPASVGDFIGEETEVIGVTTMDPLGLGPLTMSFEALLGWRSPPYAQVEFEGLVRRIDHCRKTRGGSAKILLGGPGVWELAACKQEMNALGIDFAFEGEADDIASEIFEYVAASETPELDVRALCDGVGDDRQGGERFISRGAFSRRSPEIDEIPDIVGPSTKSIVEAMRGCGIGCDFCEATRRPLRYYPPEKVRREIEVNVRAGSSHVWLHSDEIFAYEHEKNFVPNAPAIEELFTMVMETKGIEHANPTHARISIPAAYPELIGRLSRILRAGPSHQIGVQVGIETGSERLARRHMRNKTLPLRVGPDGSWSEIALQGTASLNKNYWTPAFTVQVGQPEETPEDSWDTVALINRMGSFEVNGRPLDFSVTPMQNIIVGEVRLPDASPPRLDRSQLAVYYTCYRHLAKLATRKGVHSGGGNTLSRLRTGALITLGSELMLHAISTLCRKDGLDLDKVSRYGLEGPLPRVAA